MVNLSLVSTGLLPQKTKCDCGHPGIHLVGKKWYCTECFINGDDEEQEEAYEHIRFFNHIRNNFRRYLRNYMLHAERWLGITR